MPPFLDCLRSADFSWIFGEGFLELLLGYLKWQSVAGYAILSALILSPCLVAIGGAARRGVLCSGGLAAGMVACAAGWGRTYLRYLGTARVIKDAPVLPKPDDLQYGFNLIAFEVLFPTILGALTVLLWLAIRKRTEPTGRLPRA